MHRFRYSSNCNPVALKILSKVRQVIIIFFKFQTLPPLQKKREADGVTSRSTFLSSRTFPFLFFVFFRPFGNEERVLHGKPIGAPLANGTQRPSSRIDSIPCRFVCTFDHICYDIKDNKKITMIMT